MNLGGVALLRKLCRRDIANCCVSCIASSATCNIGQISIYWNLVSFCIAWKSQTACLWLLFDIFAWCLIPVYAASTACASCVLILGEFRQRTEVRIVSPVFLSAVTVHVVPVLRGFIVTSPLVVWNARWAPTFDAYLNPLMLSAIGNRWFEGCSSGPDCFAFRVTVYATVCTHLHPGYSNCYSLYAFASGLQ